MSTVYMGSARRWFIWTWKYIDCFKWTVSSGDLTSPIFFGGWYELGFVSCASSCSLFSVSWTNDKLPKKNFFLTLIDFFQITMSKYEGVRTVVVGGKNDVQQDYCGVVGGQSTHFSDIDTEIKVRFFLLSLAIPSLKILFFLFCLDDQA